MKDAKINHELRRTYLQYIITETNQVALICIYDEKGWQYVHNQFATARDVASLFQVSKSTAYRLMKQLPRYEVEDYRNNALRTFSMVKREDLAAMHRLHAGNPNFSDPVYQRNLATRPRKKTLDN